MCGLLCGLPPDWLILLLAHRFRPLTEWWTAATYANRASALAAQTVALSCNVCSILDDKLVISLQAHVFCSLQEALHAAVLFVL